MTAKQDKNANFFRLYNAVHTRLYSFILMLVHNEKDAEDILQETASILWDKFDQYQQGTSFQAWAFVIARNQSCLFIKKKKRGRLYFAGDLYDDISDQAEKQTTVSAERTSALKKCIEKLSDSDSMLLRMRYNSNIPTSKISELLGRQSNSIYRSLSRIHTLLRQCITRSLSQQDA